MGVHLHLAAISDFNISRLIANPTLIWTVAFAEEIHATQTQQPFPPPRRALEPESIRLRETLGQYWHGIHYLMCGQVWSGEFPDAFLIDGGSYVGDVDLGYGPARAFESCEVKYIAQALRNKTPDSLARHFDANQMLDDDIYPQIWDGDDCALTECLNRFQALQHFMNHVAENNLGLTIYLQATH